MNNVVLFKSKKDSVKVLQNLSGNDLQISEVNDLEELKEILIWTDLVLIHAPSFKEKLQPGIRDILSLRSDLFIIVFTENRMPDFSAALLSLGVRDLIALSTSPEIIKKRITNLLELKRANDRDREKGMFSFDTAYLYRVKEAVKKIPGMADSLLKGTDIISPFLTLCKEILGVSRIGLVLEKNGRFVFSHSEGFSQDIISAASLDPGKGIMSYLFKSFSLLRKEAAWKEPFMASAIKEMEALGISVAAPVISKGMVAGALCVSRKQSGSRWAEEEAALISILADQTAKLLQADLEEIKKIKVQTEPAYTHAVKTPEKSRNLSTEHDINMEFVRTLAMRSSHELKNALVSIKTFTQLLPKKYKSEAFRKDFFNVVGKEVDHLNSLVEDLLFFAQPIDLYKDWKDVLDTLKSAAKKTSKEFRSIQFKYAKAKDISTKVFCDEKHIRTALSNIFENASQSMRGEGVIHISLNKYSGESSGDAPGLLISIDDTGQGIPDDVRDRIFEPFFTTKTKGLGLGLTISQKILKAHGWKLDIESSDDKTSAVIIVPAESLREELPQEPVEQAMERYRDKLLEYNE